MSSSSRDGTNDRRGFMPLWSTVFGLAQITRSDEGDHPYDTLDMAGDGSQNNPMPRWEAYGDVNIPPTNSYAVYLKLSDGGVALPWGTYYQGRPQGLKRGARALYSDGANLVHLHGSGSPTPGQLDIASAQDQKVKIDADGTGDVQVNGGTLKVARDTDPTQSGTLDVTNVQTIILGIKTEVFTMTYTDEDGAVTPLWTMTFVAGLLTAAAPTNATFSAAVKGRIKDGADRFKG